MIVQNWYDSRIHNNAARQSGEKQGLAYNHLFQVLFELPVMELFSPSLRWIAEVRCQVI